MPPAALAGVSGANLAATKEVKSPLQFRLGRPCAAAVQFSGSARQTCQNPSPAAPHPPAPRVPPSPRSRGEGWGEGQLLHMRLTLPTLDRWPDFPTTEFHEP